MEEQPPLSGALVKQTRENKKVYFFGRAKSILGLNKERKDPPPTEQQIEALNTIKAVCDGTIFQVENPTPEMLYLIQGRGWNERMARAGMDTNETLRLYDDLYGFVLKDEKRTLRKEFPGIIQKYKALNNPPKDWGKGSKILEGHPKINLVNAINQYFLEAGIDQEQTQSSVKSSSTSLPPGK